MKKKQNKNEADSGGRMLAKHISDTIAHHLKCGVMAAEAVGMHVRSVVMKGCKIEIEVGPLKNKKSVKKTKKKVTKKKVKK